MTFQWISSQFIQLSLWAVKLDEICPVPRVQPALGPKRLLPVWISEWQATVDICQAELELLTGYGSFSKNGNQTIRCVSDLDANTIRYTTSNVHAYYQFEVDRANHQNRLPSPEPVDNLYTTPPRYSSHTDCYIILSIMGSFDNHVLNCSGFITCRTITST